MNFIEWVLSSLSSALLLAVSGWLARNLILTRLKASVQHEFDLKIESLRAELRKNEESFRAELRAKEAEIEALRSGALSGMVSRQAALDKRRLEAIEQLWCGLEGVAPFKLAVSLMAAIEFEKSLVLAEREQKVRDFFAKFGENLEGLKFPKVHVPRPFVSDFAWALFSAYQAIIAQATGQLMMLKVGLNAAKLLNIQDVLNLAKSALPGYTDFIDKNGSGALFNLLDPLEAELLKELRRLMRGEESDTASVEQAARIMKEVSIVNTPNLSSQVR